MEVELSVLPSRKIKFSCFQKQLDGSGSAYVEIKSGMFACLGVELYFDDFKKFCSDLEIMYQTLDGTAELRFHYESDHISFKATSLGHIEVSGNFCEYGEYQQTLDFGFQMDQSYLPCFLDQLKRVANEIYS